jgi:cell fate regulator YaaT (PSP1 superfamily)
MFGDLRRPKNITLSAGMKVIVRTERGIELGRVVLGYCEGSGDRGISRQRWQDYLCGCGVEEPISRNGQIIRVATTQDLSDQRHLDEAVGEKLAVCRKIIGQMSLKMKPVAVEHLFGGDRIIFYFKSEKRVDFRRLVRRLAKEYQTRIEMRQVGVRDEAKLLADYERCGRACCCRAFLKMLAPVNMRMAKVQKATLDPAKISGRCSRLMCCLRYENSNYDQLRKNLPPRNTLVETPEGPAVVVDRQILTQLVVVRLADSRRIAYPLSEITIAPRKSAKASENNVENSPGKDSVGNGQSSEKSDQSNRTGRNKRRRKNRRGPSG